MDALFRAKMPQHKWARNFSGCPGLIQVSRRFEMATAWNTPQQPAERATCLRTQMEELLLNFYDAAGITPGVPSRASSDLLADNFQGCFFVRATLELQCFDKAHVLSAKAVAGAPHKAVCQFLSMSAPTEDDEGIVIRYAAGFRYGPSVTIRRGMMKAVPKNGQWVLRSLDEDVRILVLPAARKSTALDRPRLWFI
jgi:hypothetical protein